MIYENLKKVLPIVNDVPQIEEEVDGYERFFKVEEGDVVVDIGAHIGVFTKRHLDKASSIYAVEPDPLFIKELRKIDNSKVAVLDCGIYKERGKSYIKSDGNANSIGSGDFEITTITFQDLVKFIPKIGFLKIDAEGAEYDIFTDVNMQYIKENVDRIAGEFHIHNQRHRTMFSYALQMFKDYGIPYMLTSIDGVVLDEDTVRNGSFTEINFYATPGREFPTKEDISIDYNDGGCKVIINNSANLDYHVEFVNKDSGEILYSTVIGNNQWARCSFKYYVNWGVNVNYSGHQKRFDFDLKDKKVHIRITSRSLGDNLAWFPYAEEFRKKHGCKVVVSTNFNHLFEKNYPELEFAPFLSEINDAYVTYDISWYFTKDGFIRFSHPTDPRKQEMQKTATDILGLEYKEIKPILTIPEVDKTDVVTIGIHSTTQAKYWNNPTGWQEVVDYIIDKGHTPLLLSKENDGYMGNNHPKNLVTLPPSDLDTVIKEICKSKLFIGTGSGLSWLAWACNVPVILISGFSDRYTEMESCYRIAAPEGSCSGCFNRHIFNAHDWNWCPDHKGTDRQFECSKKIDAQSVINIIKEIL